MIRRVALSVGFASAVLLASPARPQAAPVDGRVHQTLSDTVASHLQRRGYELSGPVAQATMQRFNEAVQRQSAFGGTAAASRTWREIINGLASRLGLPIPLGSPAQVYNGYDDGGWGGGGAGGTWTPNDVNCDALNVEFDADGYLIIPSAKMATGTVMQFNDSVWAQAGSVYAKDMTAAIRRWVHNRNMTVGDRNEWYGAIGQDPSLATGCWFVAAPAFWRNGQIVRSRGSVCVSNVTVKNEGTHGTSPTTHTDIQCPQTGVTGGDFHFYGNGGALGITGGHIVNCIHYYPNPDLGHEGYALNAKTSVPFGVGWPNASYIPEEYKACRLHPKFIKKMAQALMNDAVDQPTYNGAPPQPIQDDDVCDNGATVRDLGDNPTNNNPSGSPTCDEPPPPLPTSTPPTGGNTTNVTVDLGPNPNIPEPTLEDPPSGIMDPFFDWLPDLPSLTLNTGSATCPTWQINAYDWNLTIDKQCPLIEQNRAAIGALMLIVFAIGAGMIVLRA